MNPDPPVEMTVEAPVKVIAPVKQAEPPRVGDLNIAPNTTAAEDKTHEGQRIINLMWEKTQQIIALSVIGSALICCTVLGVGGKLMGLTDNVQLAALVFHYGAANLVIGFYFGRTNHSRTGGVGGESVKADR